MKDEVKTINEARWVRDYSNVHYGAGQGLDYDAPEDPEQNVIKQPAIETEMSMLSNELEGLQKTISILKDRLSPVTVDLPKFDGNTEEGPQNHSSPLKMTLAEKRSQVTHARHRLEDIISNLEI